MSRTVLAVVLLLSSIACAQSRSDPIEPPGGEAQFTVTDDALCLLVMDRANWAYYRNIPAALVARAATRLASITRA